MIFRCVIVCVRACVRVCVRACVRACVCVCVGGGGYDLSAAFCFVCLLALFFVFVFTCRLVLPKHYQSQ